MATYDGMSSWVEVFAGGLESVDGGVGGVSYRLQGQNWFGQLAGRVFGDENDDLIVRALIAESFRGWLRLRWLCRRERFALADEAPVATTTAGKVSGTVEDGINVFQGDSLWRRIRQDAVHGSGGSVTAWTGVKECLGVYDDGSAVGGGSGSGGGGGCGATGCDGCGGSWVRLR